jgi:hypothetical protein
MAQAATTTGLESREKMKALQRAAKAALQHLHTHTIIKDLPISQDLKPMMEHCWIASKLASQPLLLSLPGRPCTFPSLEFQGREGNAPPPARPPRPSVTKAT